MASGNEFDFNKIRDMKNEPEPGFIFSDPEPIVIPESVDEYDFNKIRGVEPQENLGLTMSEAAKVNPDEHARILDLSKKSGIPPIGVKSNPDLIEQNIKKNATDFNSLRSRHYKTAKYLDNIDNAIIAQDDVDVLKSIEETFSGLGEDTALAYESLITGFDLKRADSLESNIREFAPGNAPVGFTEEDMSRMATEFAKREGFTTDDQVSQFKEETTGTLINRITEIENSRGDLKAEGMNVVQDGVRSAVQSMALIAPLFAASALSGGSILPAMVGMYGQTLANSYGTGRSKGLSPEEASNFAHIDASIEVITELGPAKILKNIFTGGGLKNNLLKFVGRELVSEQVATAGQSLNAYLFGIDEELNNATTAEQVIEIQGRRQVVTAIATLFYGSAQLAITTAGNKVVNSLNSHEKVVQSKSDIEQGKLDKLNEDVTRSTSKKRSEETFKQFVESVDGENNTHVFIDGAQASLYLQDKTPEEIDSDPALKIISERVAEAADLGGEVQIPIAEFASIVAGTEHFEQLRDSMTMSDQTTAPFRQEQAKQENESFVKRLTDEAQNNVSEYVEAQAIYEKVKSQLVDSGQVNEANAKVMAQIVPAWATAQASRSGKTVQQVYEESGLTIEGPQTGELARLQGELLFDKTRTDSKGRVTEISSDTTTDTVEGTVIDTVKYSGTKEGREVTLAGADLTAEEFIEQFQYDDVEDVLLDADKVTIHSIKTPRTTGKFKQVFDATVTYTDGTKIRATLSKDVAPNNNGEQVLSQNNQPNEILNEQDTGNRAGRDQSGISTPLEGAPTVTDATGPIPEIVAVAERYAEENGIKFGRQAEYVDIDPEFGARIADAYTEMEHNPQDPVVKEAYENLIKQTTTQYEALVADGYEFFFFDETNDPYEGNPWASMRDIRANKRMGVFATEAGYGSGDTDIDVVDNPMLADTGLTWDMEGEQKRVLANDLFRAVHDVFGHGIEGAGFRARGEENAWQSHVRLFTGSAQAAITTETRGQNSWLNYGPHGETNRTAGLFDTVFADQKTGLMPSWTWTENIAADQEVMTKTDSTGRNEDGVLVSLPVKNGMTDVVHFSSKKGLEVLDPEFYGNKGAGAERQRINSPNWIDRIYYGIEPGTKGGYKKESTVGNNQYKLSLPSNMIYDFKTDPDNIRPGLEKNTVNNYEKAIHDAGYMGYFLNHPQYGMVGTSFDPIVVNADVLEQPGVESTGAFKTWFGNSKAVDDNGVPLVVYHGTAAEFNSFDPDKIGSTFDIDDSGFYFTSSEEGAVDYANEASSVARRKKETGKARVIPAYLSMQNPWVIYVDTSKESGQSPIAHFEGGEGVFNRGSNAVLEYGIDAGYDGVIVRDETGIDENHEALFIVFEPNQIKSTESVNFDPTNPNIFSQPSDKSQPRGYYDPANSIIRLTESSDLSTFLHEFAHFMYEMESGNNSDLLQSINSWYKRNAAEVAAEANGYMGDSRNELEQSGFHGSQHKFNKFRTSSIGTGEGAQAFGYGLYFAENPDVAKGYQTELSDLSGDVRYTVNDTTYERGSPEWKALATIQNEGKKNAAKLLKSYKDDLANGEAYLNDMGGADFVSRFESVIKTDKKQIKQELGNLYNVDIPDEKIAQMLDWDKPLSEQPDSVQRFINDPQIKGRLLNSVFPKGDIDKFNKLKGSDIYQHIAKQFGEKDKLGRSVTPDQAYTSGRMGREGIPGIKYLDGNSRADGTGTRNFVVFDENDVTILSVNGKPVDEQFNQPSVESTEARKQRAKEQGFDVDTVYYHGTDQEFDAFKGLTFLTSDPSEASAYGKGYELINRIQKEKRLKKVSSFVSGASGEFVRYHGIISDAMEDGDGLYATDNGVVRITGNKIEFAVDVDTDYDSDLSPDYEIRLKSTTESEVSHHMTEYLEGIEDFFGDDPSNGQVLPVYIKNGKYKKLDALQANKFGKRLQGVDTDTKALQDEINSYIKEGFVGIETLSDEGVVFMGEEIPQRIIFNPSDIRSVNAQFNDPDSANLLAQSTDQPGQVPGSITDADVVAYLDNNTSGDTAKDAAIRRAVHEQFARGFETYLMEGKAPSVELRNAFRTFARWLVQIYKAIKGDLKVSLDDQMRKVFDRLLATEDQIAAAEARNKHEAMFTDATMAGMTEEQFAKYKADQEKVKDVQTETLRDKIIKQLTRQTEAWWKEEKQDIVDSEMENLAKEKVYNARTQLTDGTLKIDHATVKEMVGFKRTNKLGKTSVVIPHALIGKTAKGQQGVHPDEAAAFLGYNSGSEMINDLIKAPPIKEVADTNAEAIMVERHGDMLNDGTIQKEADDAVNNEARGKLLLTELKALAKGTPVPISDRQTIKNLAEDNIGKLSFRQIHPGKYRKAEIRAAQESATMLATGNREGAAEAKRRQVTNYYLGMAATNAKNETMKIVDRMARYNKKNVREAIIKAEGGYWDQLVKILQRFEFRKAATMNQVESLNTWLKERIESDGDGLVISEQVMNESYVTHWKNVPFTDLQGINDSVKNIEHVAKYSNKITRMQEEVDFAKLVDRWVTSMNKLPSRFVSNRTTVIEGRNWGRWFMGQMTKIPFMASWLDGGERVGISHQVLVQPFTNAYNAELKLWESIGKPVMEMIKGRSKKDQKRHNRKIHIPEIDDTLYGHQVIAVALNTGNQSNLKKMLLGESWADPDVETDISFDNPKLQAVLVHMTEADWNLVQNVWNQMELLYPQLAEVHRKTTGLTPPKVESTPITVTVFDTNGTPREITLNGGYYPVKYDPNRSFKAQQNEEKANAEVESMFGNTSSIQASVNAGATNERTGYFAPIRLSLDVIPSHFQETIHYITHHDAVRETNKLIKNKDIAKAITEKLGPEEYAQLKPWLNSIAKDGREAPTKMFWDDILQKLRFGVTLGAMGFKASTGIIQISGIFNTVSEVGSANVLQAARTVLGSVSTMQSAWQFAVENSQVLEHRAQTMDREIKNAMKKIEGKGGIVAAAQEASMKHIALIQTYMVDLPSWHAAYNKGMKEWGDEARSFQYADWVIENVQGSGATKDLAKIMRGQSETGRMFTMFMTFFSSLWNMERDLVKGAKSGLYSKTNVAAKVMFLFTLPVLFDMLMRGDFGDSDDEEPKLQKVLTNVAMYPVNSIPFIRDIAAGAIGDYGYNISPLQSIIESGTRTIPALITNGFTDKEITLSQVKGFTKFIGAAVGIPGTGQMWATGEHVYDVLTIGEEATVHQLLFGPKR
jgi:hypothetical protein